MNRKKYNILSARIEAKPLQLTKEQRNLIETRVAEQIRGGHIKPEDRESWTIGAAESQLSSTRDWYDQLAARKATDEIKVPGEADIIAELLTAKTKKKISQICEDAFSTEKREVLPGSIREVMIPNWPISVGSVLPSYLSHFASEFIAARKDPRFPRSTIRPSSRLKQIWFLSRALAGALFGIRTRTAINLVGSKRPDEIFEQSRAGKSRRIKRRKIRSKSSR